MKKHRSGVVRFGAIVFALWGVALGATSGCAVEDLDATGLEEDEGQGAAEQAVTEAGEVRRYVPMAFHAPLDGPSPATTSATTEWRTAYAIHNTSSVAQSISMKAYSRAGWTFIRSPFTVDAGGAASYQLDGSPPFKGAVVLEGTAPFEVTAIQVPIRSTVVNRPIVNAASIPSSALHFPTVMRTVGGRSTRIYVQNTRAVDDLIRFTFRDASGEPLCWSHLWLAPNASTEYDLSTPAPDCWNGDYFFVPIPNAWMGTLTVETLAPNGQVVLPDGRIVASSMLVDTAGPRGSGLEGSRGGTDPSFPVVYRSYASGGYSLTSSIAIQNLGDAPTSFTMKFFHVADGGPVTQISGTIPARGRTMVPTSALFPGFIGSARYIGDGLPVAAMTTVTRDDGGPNFEAVSIANYTGEGVGSRLSLPFVRSTTTPTDTKPKTYLAIQNVGTSSVDVHVKYINAGGSEVAVDTLTIEPGRKKSSAPPVEFGYAPYGGSALVEAVNGTGRLGVIVRTAGTTTGEDSNGIPF